MESFPLRENYEELADVFCFTWVSAMNLALWFILDIVLELYLLLLTLNFALFLGIWTASVLYGLSPGTLLEVFLFTLGYLYIYIAPEAVDSASRVFFATWTVLGSTFVIIGVAGVMAVYWNMKRKNETSNQIMFIKILNNSTILFVNGYVVLCCVCVKQENHVWKILGAVLLVVLGLLSLIWCIVRLVSWWQEYHPRKVHVSNSIEVA